MRSIRNRHGIFSPVPTRVINISSKRKKPVINPLQLDKLLKKESPTILINRRLGGIGDVLMTTPLLKKIKKLLPKCNLTYATDLIYAKGSLAEIIQHCPVVDQLISSKETAPQDYDYAVDITTTGLIKEKIGEIPPNRIDLFAEAVGISVEEDPMPLYIVTKEESISASKEIKEKYLLNEKREDINLIAIQTRSNDARRTWPFEKVKELYQLLSKNPKNRILLLDWAGTVNKWTSLPERVFGFFDRSIADTAAVLEQCDIVVAPDSSILHLAGALEKKIIAIFGPIPPQSRINHYSNTTAVLSKQRCPYFPCWYSPKCIRSSSKEAHISCLTTITAEQVQEAIYKKLLEPLNVQRIQKRDSSSFKSDKLILIRRKTSGIGDILMASNGIEAVKRKYPNHQIHLQVQPSIKEIVEPDPNLEKVFTTEDPINYRRYSRIFDISSPCAHYESTRVHLGKPVEKSRVEVFAESLGVRNLITDLKPRYYPKEEELIWAKEWIKKKIKKGKKTIFIVLGSAELYRNWPESYYKNLINNLKNNYNVLVRGELNNKITGATVIENSLSFRQAMAIMKYSDLVFTVDTGPLHVAAYYNIPTIALFGPIDHRARCKGYKSITVVKAGLECIPCWRNSSIKCKNKKSLSQYSKCLEIVKPEKITALIEQSLKK
jgi:ADP-heptose:LPS heptosyltransferase